MTVIVAFGDSNTWGYDPASEARMSREDLRLAFDCGLSYVIVSLAGKEQDVRSFTIHDGTAEPETKRAAAKSASTRTQAPSSVTTRSTAT